MVELLVLKRRFKGSPKKFLYYLNNNQQFARNKDIKEIRIGPEESLKDLVGTLFMNLRVNHKRQNYLDFQISNLKKEDEKIQLLDGKLTFAEGLSDEEYEKFWVIIAKEILI